MAVAGWRWQVGMVGVGLGLIQQTCIIYHCNRQWLTQQGSPSKAGRQCRARVGPPEAAGLESHACGCAGLPSALTAALPTTAYICASGNPTVPAAGASVPLFAPRDLPLRATTHH